MQGYISSSEREERESAQGRGVILHGQVNWCRYVNLAKFTSLIDLTKQFTQNTGYVFVEKVKNVC